MLWGINGKPFINLDQYIDVKELKSLDNEIRSGILSSNLSDVSFCSNSLIYDENNHLREDFYKGQPYFNQYYERVSGIHSFINMKKVELRHPSHFQKKHLSEECVWTKHKENFPNLIKFIDTLPIDYGRIIIFVDPPGTKPMIHNDFPFEKNDHKKIDHRVSFIWLRTNMDKTLFVMDETTEQKHHLEGYACFFNTADWHSQEEAKVLSWSIRIDGVFHEDFEKKLGIDHLDVW